VYSDEKFSGKVGLSRSNKAKLGLSIENRVMWSGSEDRKLCVTLNEEVLRNCRVSSILPRMAETAKHDRSSILHASCREYGLLILQYWADAPKIHRLTDLYEDLIKCCVGDAISECPRVKGYYTKQRKLMAFDIPGGNPESWPNLLEAVNK
ncbi:hypothetical protein Tco_1225353, partial [Tanacetum coccineum]